jgi:hypothetical protein
MFESTHVCVWECVIACSRGEIVGIRGKPNAQAEPWSPHSQGQDSRPSEPSLTAGRASWEGAVGGSLPGLLASTAPQWPTSAPKGLGPKWTELATRPLSPSR